MIVVNLYYIGKNARAFAEEMENSGTAEKIRQKSGNAGYEYFVSLSGDTVLLVDRWESQEALDCHHASPEMKEVLRLREKYGLKARADRFSSESFEKIPEKDAEFLK